MKQALKTALLVTAGAFIGSIGGVVLGHLIMM
jgi:hypothetical protein